MKYQCQTCNFVSLKWAGKCPDCNSWNSMIESEDTKNKKSNPKLKGQIVNLHKIKDCKNIKRDRIKTVSAEFNKVCGGGMEAGSIILIGGDPGIGKSTLLLQICGKLESDYSALYFSGEESVFQISKRAKRMGIENENLSIASENIIENIIASIENEKPSVVIIDSIQTVKSMQSFGMGGAGEGTISQIKNTISHLLDSAKKQNITILIVSHVTKDGMISGPKTLEHMVDTVLYFEGERHNDIRVLKAIKNRFGATDEMGIFQMQENGIFDVKNPAKFFLEQNESTPEGSMIYAGVEGSRVIMSDIQALVVKSFADVPPKRTAVGIEINRLHMIIAILQSKFKIPLYQYDVFLNVSGGIRIIDPAADLACIFALLSAYYKKPIKRGAVAFGEISLSGRIRESARHNLRMRESAKLGFETVLTYQKEQNNNSAIQSARDAIYYFEKITKSI